METTKNKLTPYEQTFFNNMRTYIDKPIYFYGSIQRDDYFPQMSDIDIDIFSDNEYSTVIMIQNYLNMSNSDFKKVIYKLNKASVVVPGYKTKYIDETNKLTVEISIYNEKHKKDVLFEHQSKLSLPIHITAVLVLLKILHYSLGILPIYYYSKYKKLVTTAFYDNSNSEFVVLDM